MIVAPLLALALCANGDRAVAQTPRFASLEGGETLGVGNTEVGLAAGYPRLSAAWVQGLTEADDYGAVFDLDWVTTEMLLGGTYRRIAWRSGTTALAFRGRAGVYADFGASWGASANRSDAGLQLAPGLALSFLTARNIISLGADVPFTVTFQRGGGYSVALEGHAAFETPLWGDLLAGARVGLGSLFSGGGAPFAGDSPRLLVELSVLLTYKVF